MAILFPPALASSASSGSGFDPMQFVPLLLIFGAIYFLVLRPQQKKTQQLRTMLSSLNRGDRVVTAGGIVGEITQVVNDQELLLNIADGVQVRVIRQMIADKLEGRTAPANAASGSKIAAVTKPTPVKKAVSAPVRKKMSKKTVTRKK